jgi:hypothetical protein
MAAEHRVEISPETVRAGMKLGPIFYTVSAEQISAFAQSLPWKDPKYAASGEEDQIAPPGMRLMDYSLLIAAHFSGGSGGVHAKQRCEFHNPLRAGQTIKTNGHIVRTWNKRGKFYFELEYEARDVATDELLTRQAITSVLLQNGRMTSDG